MLMIYLWPMIMIIIVYLVEPQWSASVTWLMNFVWGWKVYLVWGWKVYMHQFSELWASHFIYGAFQSVRLVCIVFIANLNVCDSGILAYCCGIIFFCKRYVIHIILILGGIIFQRNVAIWLFHVLRNLGLCD